MAVKLREEYCEEINRERAEQWKVKADELCGIGRYTEWLERKLASQAIQMKGIEEGMKKYMRLCVGIICGILKK